MQRVRPWLLPALSGDEIVAALERAGFRRLPNRREREAELTDGHRSLVRVPVVPVLDADKVGEILALARISVVRFLELLERTP